jgi:hypothetical protein
METRASPAERVWKGIVNRFDTGHDGLFAHVTVQMGYETDVTLGLENRPGKPKTWFEKRPPVKGEEALLRDLSKKPKGWRAREGRILRPEDEEFYAQNGFYVWELPLTAQNPEKGEER